MHALVLIAMLCGFLAVMLLIAYFAASKAHSRRTAAVSSAVLIAVAAVIGVVLAMAPRAVCEKLDGSWYPPSTS